MTRSHAMRVLSIAAIGALPFAAHGAQQMGHQMPGMGQPPSSAALTECVQAQSQATRTIDAANMRLEAARQSNSPPAMRLAMDDLQAALGSLRAQLAVCAALQAAAPSDPHAGHAMPGMEQQSKPAPGAPMMKPGSTAPAPPATADPHAGHTMPTTRQKPPAKSGAASSTKPAAPEPRMDHSEMPMGGGAKEEKVMDPVNGLMVDPATAPKTTYQGQTYYFSSEESRKEFLANPAKFAKKPKQ